MPTGCCPIPEYCLESAFSLLTLQVFIHTDKILLIILLSRLNNSSFLSLFSITLLFPQPFAGVTSVHLCHSWFGESRIRMKEKDHLPHDAVMLFFLIQDAGNPFTCCYCEEALLVCVQQHQCLLQSCFLPSCSSPLLVYGFIPPHVQNFALLFVEFLFCQHIC